MKKIVTLAAAAAMSFSIVGSMATTSAEAAMMKAPVAPAPVERTAEQDNAAPVLVSSRRARRRGFAAGLATGLVGAAIIGHSSRRYYDDRPYYRESRWERHVRRCSRRYRSYSPHTDTWIDHYGRERICRL